METTPNPLTDCVCQHCLRPVQWASRPADAGYGAFVHADTRKIACK